MSNKKKPVKCYIPVGTVCIPLKKYLELASDNIFLQDEADSAKGRYLTANQTISDLTKVRDGLQSHIEDLAKQLEEQKQSTAYWYDRFRKLEASLDDQTRAEAAKAACDSYDPNSNE